MNDMRIVSPMSESEARETLNRIRGAAETLRGLLKELYEREGWRALGYASFKACVEAELGDQLSWQHAYHVLRIERVRDEVLPALPTAGRMTDYALDTLAKVPEPQRAEVVEKLSEIQPAEVPASAAHIKIAQRLVELEQQLAPLVTRFPNFVLLQSLLFDTFGPELIEQWVFAVAGLDQFAVAWVLGLQIRAQAVFHPDLVKRLGQLVTADNKKSANPFGAHFAGQMIQQVDANLTLDGELLLVDASPADIDRILERMRYERIAQSKSHTHIALELSVNNPTAAARAIVDVAGGVWAMRLAQQIMAIARGDNDE